MRDTEKLSPFILILPEGDLGMAAKKLTFEEAMARLEVIVGLLEKGNPGLLGLRRL